MKIGIFDSGIGGLSILKELQSLAPDVEYFYISDEAFCPYGNKSDKQVIERCNEIVEILLSNEVDLIVVACNSATAVAIDQLRSKYSVPFVGVEPYINLLNSESWKKDYRGVVLTTVMTGNSQRFLSLKKRLDPTSILDHMTCPNLASVVEEYFKTQDLNKMIAGVSSELSSIKGKYSHIILGCTHYPLVKSAIEKVTNSEAVSPCLFVANQALRVLGYVSKGQTQIKFNFMKTGVDMNWKQESFEIINIDKL